MTTISMDDFLDGGILKEESFRKQVAEIDWSQYKGDRVLVRGCAEVTVPTWAYLIIAFKNNVLIIFNLLNQLWIH